MFKSVFVGIVVLLTIAVLMFAGQMAGLEWRRFFGKRKADVERDIIERSQSWTEGKQQQLAKLYLEYQRADSEEDRRAIAATVRHRFTRFDPDVLNDGADHLRRFLKKARRGEL